MGRPLLAFNWFGGKGSVVGQLLPILAEAGPHQTYVEPCGGSAALLINKPTSPVEVYNDVYGDVVNFFRVLRTRREELVHALELTPYSREEFTAACDRTGCDDFERARRFFVAARQVMMGLATTATPGRWCVAHKESRRGMACVVSRYLSAIEGLPAVAERAREWVIENDDVLAVVQRYDGPGTLHYVDPPYPMGTRVGGKSYKHEFGDEQHEELLDLLIDCKGKVAVSSYANPLYETRLAGWNRRQLRSVTRSTNFHGSPKSATRTEIVWTNY